MLYFFLNVLAATGHPNFASKNSYQESGIPLLNQVMQKLTSLGNEQQTILKEQENATAQLKRLKEKRSTLPEVHDLENRQKLLVKWYGSCTLVLQKSEEKINEYVNQLITEIDQLLPVKNEKNFVKKTSKQNNQSAPFNKMIEKLDTLATEKPIIEGKMANCLSQLDGLTPEIKTEMGEILKEKLKKGEIAVSSLQLNQTQLSCLNLLQEKTCLETRYNQIIGVKRKFELNSHDLAAQLSSIINEELIAKPMAQLDNMRRDVQLLKDKQKNVQILINTLKNMKDDFNMLEEVDHKIGENVTSNMASIDQEILSFRNIDNRINQLAIRFKTADDELNMISDQPIRAKKAAEITNAFETEIKEMFDIEVLGGESSNNCLPKNIEETHKVLASAIDSVIAKGDKITGIEDKTEALRTSIVNFQSSIKKKKGFWGRMKGN